MMRNSEAIETWCLLILLPVFAGLVLLMLIIFISYPCSIIANHEHMLQVCDPKLIVFIDLSWKLVVFSLVQHTIVIVISIIRCIRGL